MSRRNQGFINHGLGSFVPLIPFVVSEIKLPSIYKKTRLRKVHSFWIAQDLRLRTEDWKIEMILILTVDLLDVTVTCQCHFPSIFLWTFFHFGMEDVSVKWSPGLGIAIFKPMSASPSKELPYNRLTWALSKHSLRKENILLDGLRAVNLPRKGWSIIVSWNQQKNHHPGVCRAQDTDCFLSQAHLWASCFRSFASPGWHFLSDDRCQRFSPSSKADTFKRTLEMNFYVVRSW